MITTDFASDKASAYRRRKTLQINVRRWLRVPSTGASNPKGTTAMDMFHARLIRSMQKHRNFNSQWLAQIFLKPSRQRPQTEVEPCLDFLIDQSIACGRKREGLQP